MRKRVQFSTQIAPEVLARVRATLIGVQRQDPTHTLAQLTEDALRTMCETLEKQHNDGNPWPPTPARPRRGRRSPAADYSTE